MIKAVLLVLSFLSTPCIPPTYGYGSHYDGDVMAYTVEARQELGQLYPNFPPWWNGFIAVSSCDEVGNTWWVRVPHSKPPIWRDYLVADCSGHASTSRWMAQNNILLEFGGLEARKLGIADSGGVQVEVCYENNLWLDGSRGLYSSPPISLPDKRTVVRFTPVGVNGFR